MTTQQFRKLALSFQGTEENVHFDRQAFKVTKKRIFATLHEESGTVNVKLTPVDQSVYCLADPKNIFRVDNKWGLQGWTTFVLAKIDRQLMLDALDRAYRDVLDSGARKRKK